MSSYSSTEEEVEDEVKVKVDEEAEVEVEGGGGRGVEEGLVIIGFSIILEYKIFLVLSSKS